MNRCETGIHKPEYDNEPVDLVYDPELKVRGMCRKCRDVANQGIVRMLFAGHSIEKIEKDLL